MEINYKEIRETARLRLKGNWKLAILVSFVYSFMGILGDFIPDSSTIWVNILAIILSAIYQGLFIFGYSAILLHIVRGEDTEFVEMFDGCRRFLKGVGMTLVVGIYTLLWTLLLIVPGIIATIRYSMTFYIWVDNPNIGINEAIKLSSKMTHGHTREIFKLALSFIGWIALFLVPSLIVSNWNYIYAGLIMTFGMIFITPYIEVSMGILYTKLIKEMESKSF